MLHSRQLPVNQHLIELFFKEITVTQWPCGDLFLDFITVDDQSLSDRFGPEPFVSCVYNYYS